MRPFRALGIYVLLVFLGGALLAPGLHALAQTLGDTFPHLTEAPFHRYVNRSLLFLALVGIWPLFRSLGATRWQDIGLTRPYWGKFAAGLGVGFVSLAVVTACTLIRGVRQFSPKIGPTEPELVHQLLSATLTALVVALLEEILFRGAIFGAMRRAVRWPVALLCSSMIYALVHFMQSRKFHGAITWHSGLEVLPGMLRGFADWQQIIPGFFNLTLAGALLGYAYQRTGNLWLSIGLHAGWIFWLRFYGVLTHDIADQNTWFWGTSRLIDGWAAMLALAAAYVALHCLASSFRAAPTKAAAPEPQSQLTE